MYFVLWFEYTKYHVDKNLNIRSGLAAVFRPNSKPTSMQTETKLVEFGNLNITEDPSHFKMSV